MALSLFCRIYPLASSDWYFDFSDRRCPHDNWLEFVTLSEPSMGTRHEQRTSTLAIRLLGAYQDGHIELSYPEVYDCDLRGTHIGQGHGDWRCDEFRLGDSGRVIHEIEWASFGKTNQSNRYLGRPRDPSVKNIRRFYQPAWIMSADIY
jgi:hypothetical protein